MLGADILHFGSVDPDCALYPARPANGPGRAKDRKSGGKNSHTFVSEHGGSPGSVQENRAKGPSE